MSLQEIYTSARMQNLPKIPWHNSRLWVLVYISNYFPMQKEYFTTIN
jgi:hypothetical protein